MGKRKLSPAKLKAWQEKKDAEKQSLNERFDAFLAEYDELDDDDRGLIDERVKHWMTAPPVGRGYSERNAMLVVMQAPGATEVRGYVEWRTAGRQVKAGPKSIKIVQHVGAVKDEDESGQEVIKRRLYKLISVFDRSDTYPIEQEAAS